ncbi:MAG: YggS family pyridoxal phosphate-dependent enzyme [Gallionella sp.]
MTTIASNLQAVRDAITAAAAKAGRHADEVCLLAVSKTFPLDALREAYQAGQTRFAESYVQEALDKIAALNSLAIEWHYIGPIQSNKTRAIAENFAWVHSVDRLKIAERLSDQRPAHLPLLQVCLQVNISGEDSKSGVSPDQVGALARAIANLPGLKLRGLMTVPAPSDDVAAQRLPFARLRKLRDQFAALEDWRKEILHAAVEGVAQNLGLKLGQVAQPLRVAMIGSTVSPAIDITLELLGKARCLKRLEAVLSTLPET